MAGKYTHRHGSPTSAAYAYDTVGSSHVFDSPYSSYEFYINDDLQLTYINLRLVEIINLDFTECSHKTMVV